LLDEFQKHFWWIGGLLGRPVSDVFEAGSPEHAVIERLRQEWGKRDTAELLIALTADHGDVAGRAVERFLEVNILKDWAAVGCKEAHEGTEVEDFIRVLWAPLRDLGFAFTIDRENGAATFCVTTCPIHDLAERTGLHGWLYHLACSTDHHSARAFSPRLGFARTETLMQGGACCDHRYYRVD
jgi:predicted ArsR family transcriptional regulator